jgi:hypothetical protein
VRKSVGQASTAGEQTQQKPCRTSSDIGAAQEKSYSRTSFDVGSEMVKMKNEKLEVQEFIFNFAPNNNVLLGI